MADVQGEVATHDSRAQPVNTYIYLCGVVTLLGTWNVMSLYRAGALMAAARELARYKLDLVGVQEVRWEKEGTVKAGDYSFSYGKGNENHQLGTEFFVHHRIL